MENYVRKSMIATGALAFIALLAFIVAWTSFFVTSEGHVDVVKRFSKATYTTEPGLNFKIPLVDTTTTIEVRTRKNSEEMQAATSEQMPVQIIASMNWTAKKSDVLNLFKDYGSLDQFEQRVIDPRFRAIVKESVAKFKAEDTISKRDLVTLKVKDALIQSIGDLPIEISAINIENIELPANYLKSIETKQTEKNLADAEVFKLEKQKLEAQRAVNTADAEAQSIKLKATAEAEAINLKGQAEAKSIEAKGKALQGNPLIIELTKAQNWNGSYLTTGIGQGTNVLMDIRKDAKWKHTYHH